MKSDPKCERIIQELYNDIPGEIIDLVTDPNASDFMTLLEIICKLAAIVEVSFIGDSRLKGHEKRYVVTNLARLVITNHCPAEYLENILGLFDEVFEKGLEMVIHFAKNNKVLKKIKKGCC
tara:strand:- start:119 stop:481 length:363 start_codon:yes stop_codon:yes gene_type:complete